MEESASGCLLMNARAGNSCPEVIKPAHRTHMHSVMASNQRSPSPLKHGHVPAGGEVRTAEADSGGEHIDIEHLVVGAHAVALEEPVLECGREAIKAQIAQHER